MAAPLCRFQRVETPRSAPPALQAFCTCARGHRRLLLGAAAEAQVRQLQGSAQIMRTTRVCPAMGNPVRPGCGARGVVRTPRVPGRVAGGRYGCAGVGHRPSASWTAARQGRAPLGTGVGGGLPPVDRRPARRGPPARRGARGSRSRWTSSMAWMPMSGGRSATPRVGLTADRDAPAGRPDAKIETGIPGGGGAGRRHRRWCRTWVGG
jgi:hypothetical protein